MKAWRIGALAVLVVLGAGGLYHLLTRGETAGKSSLVARSEKPAGSTDGGVDAAKLPPPSYEGTLRKIRAVNDDKSGVPFELRLAQATGDLDAAQARAFLERLVADKKNYELRCALTLLSRWASLDPLAALDYVRQAEDKDLRGWGTSAVRMTWAEHDPEAAMKYALSLPKGEDRTHSLVITANKWCEVDPGRAYAVLSEGLPQDELIEYTDQIIPQLALQNPVKAAQLVLLVPYFDRRAGLISGIAEQWSLVDRPAALTWCQSLSSPGERNEALVAVVRKWAESDPLSAGDYAQKNLGGEGQLHAFKAIAYKWNETDSVAALRWAEQMPAGRNQEHVLYVLIGEWSGRDPRAAADYILKMEPGWLQMEVSRAAARHLAQTDVQAALAYAQRLPSAESRQGALEQVFRIWKESDPRAARVWIENSTLSEGLKKRLLQKK